MLEAATYRRLIDRLQPRELLGLTATPERADGVDVRAFFDGRTAAELRLWDALGADLLCPFHYFAIADGTDLRRVSWTTGHVRRDELSTIYTGNRCSRCHRSQATARQGARPRRNAWPRVLRQRGTRGVHGPDLQRGWHSRPSRQRPDASDTNEMTRCAIFVTGASTSCSPPIFSTRVSTCPMSTRCSSCDPPRAPPFFLQQLGTRAASHSREGRCSPPWTSSGYHRKEFRFDLKLRALTGQTRRGLEREIERGLPVPAVRLPDRDGPAVTEADP